MCKLAEYHIKVLIWYSRSLTWRTISPLAHGMRTVHKQKSMYSCHINELL